MDPSVSLAVQLKDLGEAIVIALGSEGSPGETALGHWPWSWERGHHQQSHCWPCEF